MTKKRQNFQRNYPNINLTQLAGSLGWFVAVSGVSSSCTHGLQSGVTTIHHPNFHSQKYRNYDITQLRQRATTVETFGRIHCEVALENLGVYGVQRSDRYTGTRSLVSNEIKSKVDVEITGSLRGARLYFRLYLPSKNSR